VPSAAAAGDGATPVGPTTPVVAGAPGAVALGAAAGVAVGAATVAVALAVRVAVAVRVRVGVAVGGAGVDVGTAVAVIGARYERNAKSSTAAAFESPAA
jgi:hypothetical protein